MSSQRTSPQHQRDKPFLVDGDSCCNDIVSPVITGASAVIGFVTGDEAGGVLAAIVVAATFLPAN
jgi:hypothetical protein